MRLLCELHPVSVRSAPSSSAANVGASVLASASVSAESADGRWPGEPTSSALEDGTPDAISREILDFLRTHLPTLFDRMAAIVKVRFDGRSLNL